MSARGGISIGDGDSSFLRVPSKLVTSSRSPVFFLMLSLLLRVETFHLRGLGQNAGMKTVAGDAKARIGRQVHKMFSSVRVHISRNNFSGS